MVQFLRSWLNAIKQHFHCTYSRIIVFMQINGECQHVYVCWQEGLFSFLASTVEFRSLGGSDGKTSPVSLCPVTWDDQQAPSVDLSGHIDRCHFSNVNINVFKSRSVVDFKKVKVIQFLNPF